MNAIEFINVSKKFKKGEKFDSLRDFIPNLVKGAFGQNGKNGNLKDQEFWAVKDVSFELKKGEALGIIGPNGAGKSTILKMLSRIYKPTSGEIKINGKLSALLEVGAGFHPDLTGRENIYLSAAIIGMKKKEVEKKIDSIIKFSELKDFIDTPVKKYSSGMYVRLGFSISAHMDPDILLLDEVLAVGDMSFQSKCMHKMKELVDKGVTMIFISHNLNAVELMCKKTIYLKQGQIRKYSDTINVINEYKKDAFLQNESGLLDDSNIRYGTKEIEIKKVELFDKNNIARNIFKIGESLKIRLNFNAKNIIEKPEFFIGFYTETGILISAPNTRDHKILIDKIQGEGYVDYFIESIPFNSGKYLLTIAVWDSTGHIAYDHHEKLYDFIVEDSAMNNSFRERFGLIYIRSNWKVENHVKS